MPPPSICSPLPAFPRPWALLHELDQARWQDPDSTEATEPESRWAVATSNRECPDRGESACRRAGGPAEVRAPVRGHRSQQSARGPWGHVWEGGQNSGPVPGWPSGWSLLRGAAVCPSRVPRSPDIPLLPFAPLASQHPQERRPFLQASWAVGPQARAPFVHILSFPVSAPGHSQHVPSGPDGCTPRHFPCSFSAQWQ